MSDYAIKRRLARAKERAEEMLTKTGYEIINSDNTKFCLLGVREHEIRFIRIVVDKISDEDKRVVKGIGTPPHCTKEIWCKRHNSPAFKIEKIQ